MLNEISGFFQATFGILLYWAALATILTGLGLGIRRLFRIEPLNLDHCLTCFWVGFAVIVGFLQLWHLFFAVTWRALAIVALAGAASVCWNAELLVDFVRRVKRHDMFLVGVVTVLLVSIWLANQAAGPPTEWNSSSYHTQIVRWTTKYPAVLGLGNLYDAFAYNPSSLLYAAMLEWGPWAGRANHVANGLLLLMFLLWVLRSGSRVFREAPGAKGPYIFDLVLLTPAITIALGSGISSFTTDIPPALVLFVACSLLYRILIRDTAEPAVGFDAAAIVCLAAVAVCLKANMIAIGPPLIAVLLLFLLRCGASPSAMARLTKWSLAVCILLIVPWMVHGMLLSGYPLFPSTFLGLNRDWKVPVDYATAERWYMMIAARRNVAGGMPWEWIPNWFKIEMHFLYQARANQWTFGALAVLAPSALTVAAILIAAISRIREVRPKDQGWLLFFPCAMAALVWLCTAPASRFGFGFLWSLAAAAVAQAASPYNRQARRIALPVAAIALVPLLLPITPTNTFRRLAGRLFIPPGPDHGFYRFPKAELKRFTTQSGLVLLVPVKDERCYDAPLPCTPDPVPNLVLSTGLDGRPKFVTNGPWQPIDWPNIPYHDVYVRYGPRRTQQ